MGSEQFAQLGQRIRSARLAADLTQQQLADRVGITKNTVSEIERGREPSLSVLLDMAGALGISEVLLISDDPAALTPAQPVSKPQDSTLVAVPELVLRTALQQTEANLVRLSEISGYAKGVLEMMRAVTAAQEKVVSSLAPWVRHEERVFDTDPQLLEDAAADVMRDAERVAQAQRGKGAPKPKKKSAG